MLLSLFNFLLFCLDLVIIFCDFPLVVDVIGLCIVFLPSVINALVQSLIYQKRVFRCHNCGKDFRKTWQHLFGQLSFWRLPRRFKNGEEVDSCLYGKAYITCPHCHSWDCGVDLPLDNSTNQ